MYWESPIGSLDILPWSAIEIFPSIRLLTYSLDKAQRDNSLDIEGSLALDLKAFSAEGSAKYLNEMKSSKHEARLNVSCTVERRTRRIPMETFSKMTYEKQLDSPFYTHFVSEVVEGASATLTFARSCSSEEEAKEITGELKIKVVSIPVSGSARVKFKEGSKKLNVKISYSGAIAENVASLEDAQRVAKEMPSKLMTQMNTRKYKLLPLSLLDSKANKLIRSIDTGLLTKTDEALKAGNEATLSLKEIAADEVFQETFPSIRKQISTFQNAFAAAETDFTSQVRDLLPELRNGNTDANEKIAKLEQAVGLHSQRTGIAQQFVTAKQDEALVLRDTVAALLADKFEDQLGEVKSGSLVDAAPPRLFLSIGGGAIGVHTHPLQASFASASLDNLDSGKDADLPVEEWFENPQTRANLAKSCNDIRKQRKMAIPGVSVSFGVASIDVATRGGKKTRTNIGDVILQKDGVLSIVTGMLPKEPSQPTLTVKGQTLTVKWSSNRAAEEETAIPTTGFALRYRRVRNPKKDGPSPRAGENELFQDIRCSATDDTIELKDLSDDCDYQVELSVQTCVGSSPWSPNTIERTERRMTEAHNMLDFFFNNKAKLIATPNSDGNKPWGFDKDKKTLFLGHTEYLRRKTNVKGFQDEAAVRIVDVATEYKPEIQFPALERINETIVAVFTGPSGAGKSTQINAFVSYLLGGEVDDPARVLLIDGREFKQSASVTQLVTCFRIRPFAPAFKNKTLMIVDTPGYGDSRGVERDAFITAAMSEFFGTVSHVNSVIFVCKANEVRTTLLSPVATYVSSLFAKDVRKCLRTLYTFSDGGKVLAHDTLEGLQWPVENGEVQVNNSAFGLEVKGGEVDRQIRSQWIDSIKGQSRLQETLFMAEPVPTAGSAKVTKKRMQLEKRCQLAQGMIMETANVAQSIINQLKILAVAVAIEVVSDQQIAHKYIETFKRDVPSGKHATVCTACNYTCHEICSCSNDEDKYYCAAIDNGENTVCPNKCNWTKHHNATFIIAAEEKTEYITPRVMIDPWNMMNRGPEGALVELLDKYLSEQATLHHDILDLADLNDRLKETALMHDPSGPINYVDLLIMSAKAGVKEGSTNEMLITQLMTARKTLQLHNELKNGGQISADLVILMDLLDLVRREMMRRIALSANDRAAEGKKPCSLYNGLRRKLPLDLMQKAPPPLRTQSSVSEGALYKENLTAVVSLVELVLKDGGVVAALAAIAAS